MRDELAGILRATGVTVLLVTHEQEEAFAADRVAVMRDGAIVQAVPEEIYYAPATRWAADLRRGRQRAARRLAGRVGTLVGRFLGAQRRRPRRRRGARPARALALNLDLGGRGEAAAPRAPRP